MISHEHNDELINGSTVQWFKRLLLVILSRDGRITANSAMFARVEFSLKISPMLMF